MSWKELDMTKKYVVELDIYTDGDYHINFEDLKGHNSRYFEQDLYEYTIIDSDSHKCKVRRVFDDLDEAVSFFDITDRISKPLDYFITDILMVRINQCIEEFWRFGRSSDSIDGNVTINMDIYTVETGAKKIKNIIFENGAEIEKVKGESSSDV